ncbi:MAG: class I SAM-dependent methyltransferase [Steroidobacteraceae bacterium]
MKVSAGYDPASYWNARVLRHGGLRGTGHISYGENYNRWVYRAKDRALRRVMTDRPIAGCNVLDVGCGGGYFVDWYVSRGARLTGIDISAHNIEKLRARGVGSFHVMDVSAVDARPLGLFDIVNVWDVLYHIVDDDAFERALRFIVTNVECEGLLLISDQLGASTDTRPAEHVRLRCLRTYLRVLSDLGFRLVTQQFVYRWLNRHVSIQTVDSQLGRFYYWLDGRETALPPDNVSLGVWQRTHS